MNHYWIDLYAAAQPWLAKALHTLQAPYVLVELFATACGLLGSLVLALKGKNAAWGWVLFALSNVGWLVFSHGHGHWFFFIQQIGFSITSAIGIWSWLIEPRIDANKLLARLTCWRKGHWMHLAQMGDRDGDGKLHWPCQRCGAVQVLDHGLAARGHVTVKSLAANERGLT